jgi:SAM-dependent methyltransferase
MNSPVLIKETKNSVSAALSGERLADLQKYIGRNRFLPVPSAGETFVGDGNYLAIGTEFLGYFIELGGLHPFERVVDIGCGIGRMAVPLTQYLDPEPAHYVGIDPVSAGIQWCTRNIGSHYPNFRFMHLDIANELYNPDGYIRGAEIALPFTNGSFDFAIMTSVVTHLPADEISPYFSEISRLLEVGGRLFLSAFVIMQESDRNTKPRVAFQRIGEGPAWCANPQAPLAAVAFDDGFIDEALQSAGFEIVLKRFGHWRGSNGAPHYQDFFVAQKLSRGKK